MKIFLDGVARFETRSKVSFVTINSYFYLCLLSVSQSNGWQVGHSTVLNRGSTQNNWASGIDFSLKWRHREQQWKVQHLFFGQISSISDPDHMHRGSQTHNPPFSGPNEETLFELFFAAGGLQCDILSGPLLIRSGWTETRQVSAKADQLRDRCCFPCLGSALLRGPLFPGANIELFVFEHRETKKVPLWRRRLHGGAWLPDLTGKVPLFRQKSLTCTHSEKSVAQPAGPSGRCAEKRLAVVIVKVLGLFHNIFHNLHTVQLFSAALCCRCVT